MGTWAKGASGATGYSSTGWPVLLFLRKETHYAHHVPHSPSVSTEPLSSVQREQKVRASPIPQQVALDLLKSH
jgi:hypothetical protein